MTDSVVNRPANQPVQVPVGDGPPITTQNPPPTHVGPPPTDDDGTFLPSYGKPILEAPRSAQIGADLALIIQEIRAKLSEVKQQASTEDVLVRSERQKTKHDERMKQLDDAIKSQEKADKGGLIGKILGWIAAAAMVIAGALLMIAGGAGVGLLVGGIAMMAVMTLEETGVMEEMTKAIAKGLEDAGLDPKAAQILAAVITAIIVIAATSITGVGAAKAAAGATAKLGLQISQAAMKSANVLKAVEAARHLSTAAKATQALATLGQAGATAAKAGYGYEASMHKADAAESLAFIKKLQKMIEDELQRLEQMLRELNEGTNIAIDAIRNEHETNQRILQI
jgi:hypothetical protein